VYAALNFKGCSIDLRLEAGIYLQVRFLPGMQQMLQLRGWLLGGAPGSLTGEQGKLQTLSFSY